MLPLQPIAERKLFMDKYVGKRLDGRYEIREIIGMGGMAVVYKAFDNVENKIVAIKILKDEFSSNEEFLRRFRNESKAIALLTHPNIVDVYDVSFGDLIQYIVMEYIDGCTLKEYIEREGSLNCDDAVYFTMQILKSLQHAHDKGIVHRDVKPQNIMILPDGTIKVMDFGIARFSRSDQRTITDKAIGSVHYISPEQARGEKTDEKSDIYSVGVMLYEMLTGKLPFQAESAVSVAIMQLQRDPELPTEINPSIPKGLEQITVHAMQKTPEKRYQSAAEMLCDLNEFRKDPTALFDYNYFVDDSPTKFVSSIGTESEEEVALGGEEYEESGEVEKKSNMIPILAGVLSAVVLAVLALVFFVIVPWLTGGTGEEFACPKFIGKNYEEITADKEWNSKLEIELKWEENNEHEFGVIYEQSVIEGKMLKNGENIILYVSMGQKKKRVPKEIIGLLESAAVSQLEAEGFSVLTAEESSDDVEQGRVIRTEPQVTTVVAEGEKITVFISTGKPTKNVKIGDCVGKTQATAEKIMTDGGLSPVIEETELTFEDKYYPVGYVVKQEPAASDEEVPEGTSVKLFVCAGYKTNIDMEFPEDLAKDTYKITLWQDGKMVKEGDTIDSAKLKKYTFENISAKDVEVAYTVKLSKGDKNYDIFDVAVNHKSARVKVTVIKQYPVEAPVESKPSTPSGTGAPSTPSDVNSKPVVSTPAEVNSKPVASVSTDVNSKPKVSTPAGTASTPAEVNSKPVASTPAGTASTLESAPAGTTSATAPVASNTQSNVESNATASENLPN